MTITWNDVRKYIEYVFDTRGFQSLSYAPQGQQTVATFSPRSVASEHLPAIMIHGIMPRSGTVYVGELLRLHPELHALPRDLWELPSLQLSPDLLKLQRRFVNIYEQNGDKLGSHDFLTVFGAGMLSYLQAATPTGKRMLLKVPSVHYLHYFPVMYPNQHLLVLMRDGRDVVQSTIRTWPVILFSFACRRWKRAATMVLAYHRQHQEQEKGYWLARFEDALQEPESFVREACRRFDLDVERYPFDQIETIMVRGSSQLKSREGVVWAPKERPRDFKPRAYWRAWSAWCRWTFKRIAGTQLEALGYGTEPDW